MRFVLTTHAHLDGVALSCPGHFGGERFHDDTAALERARELAGAAPIAVERETVRPRRAPR